MGMLLLGYPFSKCRINKDVTSICKSFGIFLILITGFGADDLPPDPEHVEQTWKAWNEAVEALKAAAELFETRLHTPEVRKVVVLFIGESVFSDDDLMKVKGKVPHVPRFSLLTDLERVSLCWPSPWIDTSAQNMTVKWNC